MKNRKLHQWVWRWHFIAGIISLPFVLVLSVTGAIYLFHSDVQNEVVAKIQTIKAAEKAPISYQKQWEIAKKYMKKEPDAVLLNSDDEDATPFISGRFSHKNTLFINKYTGKVTGTFSPKDTWMHSIRKLHGELLGGSIGTKIVELIASWMVVLILSGLYIWGPFTQGIKGLFTIRLKEGKRVFYRDLHAFLGFWMSILLLLVLAGGFPWTDVFGANFKTVQQLTNTGYPKTWNGRGLFSKQNGEALVLEEMVRIAKNQKLKGEVTIGLPKNSKSTFSVSNKTFPLADQKMLHFDQYSGDLIKAHNWSDVGFLMQGRMWLMAFHQGQFNGWNWWLMFFTAVALTLMSLAGLLSYWYRKPQKKWGIPNAPKHFSVGYGIVLLVLTLGLIFPLFGASLVIIFMYSLKTKLTYKK